ncbi:hypothetical protein NE237_020831 [Protea cynaroides]|uniref:Uncharacterized protein n=1 Tax=Protea cynaroides TaxID=273540 RepID=A0A9Q0H6P5_9MAGN|nr:hypothetical protein NE237_020831 [Protea cynaroides]
MGPERNGRVRGAGKAVAPSDVGLARSNVQKKKEDEELQATISNMQGEINDLKEQLTEMDQIKTQLMEMDQIKAQLKEMDQLKVQLTQMDQMKTQITFLTQAFTGRNTSQSSIHLYELRHIAALRARGNPGLIPLLAKRSLAETQTAKRRRGDDALQKPRPLCKFFFLPLRKLEISSGIPPSLHRHLFQKLSSKTFDDRGFFQVEPCEND